MSTTSLVTAEQFMRMSHDGHRYELVAGELRTMSPPDVIHGALLARVAGLFDAHAREHDLGLAIGGDPAFLVERDPDTVRGPDVAFIRKERLTANPPGHCVWPGAPDLAVEILSPNDRPREVREKVRCWLRAGVRMVWVVDPDRRTVVVHRPGRAAETLTEDADLDGEDILPGFRCRVAGIFLPD
ncbi:MAG: Uma2 family endonuclease [Planctomycetes bacterium]|nr:Uma2 family endonuclease [Planctomycetota bacterium]